MKRIAVLLLAISLPTCLGCGTYEPPKESIPTGIPAASPRVLPPTDGSAPAEAPTAPSS